MSCHHWVWKMKVFLLVVSCSFIFRYSYPYPTPFTEQAIKGLELEGTSSDELNVGQMTGLIIFRASVPVLCSVRVYGAANLIKEKSCFPLKLRHISCLHIFYYG